MKKSIRKLSYESDGKMGKDKNKKNTESKKEELFFNTTQDSE
ncbi:hypothetical protein [Metabacillus litoralis]|nr:hypothetical protein [Metabacillus litoralis]